MLHTAFKRLGTGLLAAAMICTLSIPQGFSYGATASVPKDVKGHWAETYITQAIGAGIINGYPDGLFKPDSPVSRAEFIHMINAVLGNNGTATINFSDTPKSEWYYTDVTKAVAAGYVNGYSGGTFQPNSTISRQEAVVILARVVPTYGKGNSLSKFGDAGKVADWARESFQRIYGKGYIGAYDDAKLHPEDKMTRAQAAKIICDIMSKETIVKTDPSISATGSTLSGSIYSNGVTLTKSLDEGNASINNCIILGTLNIQGGGENSVEISNSRVRNASVAKPSGRVRVYVKGETSVENLTASNEATLQTSSLTGGDFGPGFKSINMVRDSNIVYTGNFEKIEMTGPSAEATFTAGTITNLIIGTDAKDSDITVETSATITTADVNSNAQFHGNGTIRTMNVNADGVSYSKKPDRVNVGKNVTNNPDESETTDGDITISPGKGATGVKRSTDITITFKNAMKLYNGDSISNSDIEDFVELNEGTSNGSSVDFDATINSAKKIITITPSEDLDDDEKYYVIIDSKELKDSNGDYNDSFSSYFYTGDSDGESSTTIGDITVTPGDKSTDVSRNTKITLEFKYAMKLYGGGTISSSDIEDFVDLRERTANGSHVDFDATINSSKKIITITPDDTLDDDTRYYISIDRNELKDSYGDGNPSFSSYFTTGDDEDSSTIGDITISPANRKTGVDVDTDITLTFKYAMKKYNGTAITSSNIDDFVELHKGSSSSSTSVSFDATINSAKKIITIRPTRDLSDDTKYYVTIDKNELKDSYGDGNPSFSAYFTTGDESDSDYITFSPRKGTSDVDISVEPEIKLSEKMVTYSGSSLTGSNLADVIDFRKEDASGKKVSYTASLNSSKTTIYIEPTYKLTENTKYYLAIKEKSLKTDAKGTVVPATYVTWNTTDNSSPNLTALSASAASDTSATVTAAANQSGTFYAVIVPYSALAPSATQIINGQNSSGTSLSSSNILRGALGSSSKTIGTMTGLSAGTPYKVYAVHCIGTATSAIYSASVTTTTKNTPTINSISASGSTENTVSVSVNANNAGTIYAVLIPNAESEPTATQIRQGKDNGGSSVSSGRFQSSSVSAGGTKGLTFTGLTAGTSYKVCATLVDSTASQSPVKSLASLSTTAPTIPNAKLRSLIVDGHPIIIGSGTTINAEIPYKDNMSSVSVEYTVDEGSAQSKDVNIINGQATATITATGSGKYNTTYTIIITVKGGDTRATITVNGASVSDDRPVSIPTAIEIAEIAVTAAPGANVTINKLAVNELILKLSPGESKTVTVVVTNDISSKTYTFTITRAAAAS